MKERKFKKEFIEEINYVTKKITEDIPIRERAYYLSAIYGTLTRLLNLDYDEEWIFLHLVFNALYTQVNNLLDQIEAGREKIISLPPNYFEKLAKVLRQFAEAIEKDLDVYPLVLKIVPFSYLLTGNGFYLYKKGLLKLKV